jgi:hypothetical protein
LGFFISSPPDSDLAPLVVETESARACQVFAAHSPKCFVSKSDQNFICSEISQSFFSHFGFIETAEQFSASGAQYERD